jgi:hypothetical protein
MQPQNRFSFFDSQLQVMGNVVKPRFSGPILNTFLTPARFIPAIWPKINKMNGLQRNPVKIDICRAFKRILEGHLSLPLFRFRECQGGLLNDIGSF